MSCQILIFRSLVAGGNYGFELHGAGTGGIRQDGDWVEVLSACTRNSLCTELYLWTSQLQKKTDCSWLHCLALVAN